MPGSDIDRSHMPLSVDIFFRLDIMLSFAIVATSAKRGSQKNAESDFYDVPGRRIGHRARETAIAWISYDLSLEFPSVSGS